MDLDDVADDLYGAPPDQFVARRDAAAKEARAAGDRDLAADITALRKPTVAAWLVNALLRDVPGLAEQLVALGDSLREAERSLDGAGMRDLSRQRRALVTSLVGRAKALGRQAGHKVGDAVAQEVDATLTAALADPGIARDVTSGRLTAGREFVGFGGIASGEPTDAPSRASRAPSARATDADDGGAAAKTSAPRSRAHLRVVEPPEPDPEPEPRETAADRRRRREREDAVANARRAREEAADASRTAREQLDDATRERDEQQQAAADAEQAATDARQEVDDLNAALVDLRHRLAAAQKASTRADEAETRATSTLHAREKEVTSAQRDLRHAERAEADATRAVERAEEALADLDGA
ncbi:hypothetical protein GXP71_15135 [Cellulomonas sp. H30R-01]|uniref:hypothetical protein n=1 Tax=Cellulomonas sp. H30R-01 TaxID=2704467 RepID=UPI00138D995A|nr:hypothetical protein [Cellulomonas sp. H30R-01]QHT57276.1 hypothetical protein GXP71_15135 [Cellulomonas sp. H30R-01]